MLYIIYVVTTRIPLYMKIPEWGSQEPKHVGECFFMIIQFKCLSIVSAYCWNCLRNFIIVFRDRGTVPHFESHECSECPRPLPHPSPTTCFFIIHFNTFLSPIRRHKLRVVGSFLKFFIISTLCMCAKYCRYPVFNYIVFISVLSNNISSLNDLKYCCSKTHTVY